jgi:hypothetical protein
MIPYSQNIAADLYAAGQRMSDVINETLAHSGWWTIKDKFMAFKLSDGSTDKILYDNKRDAVCHQRDEKLYAYVCFRQLGNGAKPKDCAIIIKFHRDVYKAGYRLPDPDDVRGGPSPVMTTRWNDFYNGRVSRMPQTSLWSPNGQMP